MIVTESAMRPASDKKACFYYQQEIGVPHKPDCVLVQRKVKIRMTVEYVVNVPAGWTKDEIEFHRNESSWCADNVIDELSETAKEHECLCNCVQFEHVEDVGEPFLKES